MQKGQTCTGVGSGAQWHAGVIGTIKCKKVKCVQGCTGAHRCVQGGGDSELSAKMSQACIGVVGTLNYVQKGQTYAGACSVGGDSEPSAKKVKCTQVRAGVVRTLNQVQKDTKLEEKSL